MEPLRIVEASPALKDQFLAMIAVFYSAGEEYSNYQEARSDPEAYLRRLELDALGKDLRPGSVACTTWWLIDEEQNILGESRLKHTLNRELFIFGGHIGYRVRPDMRRRGYANRLLGMTLEKARQRGLQRVLVTCDDDNLASARVIEANGGILENRLQPPGMLKLVRRYWIDL